MYFFKIFNRNCEITIKEQELLYDTDTYNSDDSYSSDDSEINFEIIDEIVNEFFNDEKSCEDINDFVKEIIDDIIEDEKDELSKKIKQLEERILILEVKLKHILYY